MLIGDFLDAIVFLIVQPNIMRRPMQSRSRYVRASKQVCVCDNVLCRLAFVRVCRHIYEQTCLLRMEKRKKVKEKRRATVALFFILF